MSYRDDFNSSMSSPNNYGKNTTYGNSNYSGGYGGTNNAGGGGYTTIAQKNFARAGGSFGRGFGFGSLNNPNNGLSRGSPVRRGGLLGDEFVQVGPVPNVQGPVPTSLPPPVTQEDIPGPPPSLPPALTMAGQYANPFRWPTQRRADVGGPNFPYNNGFNGRPAANYPPTPTWAGGPTYNQNVGGLVGGSGGHAMGGGWNPNSGQFGGPR